MQFIMYGLDDPETLTPPTPEMLAQLDQLTKDSIAAGVLITTGGASNTSTRVKQAGGQVTVTDGPFIEAKELMGGFAVIEVPTVEDAVAWAKRFRAIVGDGTSEIVRIYGPGDFAAG